MVQALVVTLREGLEAALVVGIILAYLNKTGLQKLNSYVKWGLILGVVSSIAGAFIFNSIGVDPDNKIFEGTTYLVSAIFVITMVMWMWQSSRKMKQGILLKLESIVVSEHVGRQGLGLLLFTFFMVFREGIETVLFIAALGKGTSPAASLLGASIGLLIAVGIGMLMVYGSLKIDIGLFFKVTGIALVLLAVKLFAGGMLEFGEAHIIPLAEEIEEVLEFVAEGRSSQIISIILAAVPLIAFGYSILKNSLTQSEVAR